jgi:indolepyruvate ferredoxin oxidoreductase alpha subunit
MDRLLDSPEGSKVLLLGNEAIARAALEAGVAVATTYPGTPASEIGDALARVAVNAGIYFEYSTNEIVATELAAAAAVAGVRAMTSMKHVGLNVAADALMTFAYTGTRGGFVLVTADDPSCHSSQNEQDNRYYALLAGLPLLEPSNPQECYEMTKDAFGLSERLELPIIVRTTTRVSHVRGPVVVGKIVAGVKKKPFVKEPSRFVTVPGVARERHLVLLRQLEEAEKIANESHFNKIYRVGGSGRTGVITSSAAFNYVIDSAEHSKADLDILKLGFSHPLPNQLVGDFLRAHDTVAVIEELEPILETAVRALAQHKGISTRILGKADGLLPRAHEFNQAVVAGALNKAFGIRSDIMKEPILEDLPSRPPVLCAGCPHTATYYAVNKATEGKAIFASDIGCYSLGVGPPHRAADLLLCMGSSVGTAGGLAKVSDQPVIAFIGDSTFFHAGIPGLINAVHNGHRFLLIILDNRTTAMTGHQPHPGSATGPACCDITSVSIEEVVKACGVKWLKVVDPYDVMGTTEIIKEGMKQDKVSVVIARRECVLIAKRGKEQAVIHKEIIDTDVCTDCGTCTSKFQCPAISKSGEVRAIDQTLCSGCAVCEQVCPSKAIKGVK